MSHHMKLSVRDFPTLKTASYKLLNILSEHLDVDTAYIVKRDTEEMTVLSSVNKEEELIPEGYSVEYGGTYCRLTINQGDGLTIADLTKDELTRELEVTKQLNLKGFLGVPMNDHHGNLFGTLCVMSKNEKNFTQEDKRYITDMADVLSYMVDFDHTNRIVASLIVPIVPVTKGISILPLQGAMDQSRSERVTEAVLSHCTEKKISVFIFDLSGLVLSENAFPDTLARMPEALRVMGVKPVFTGITPDMARMQPVVEAMQRSKTETYMSLESALNSTVFAE
ncbi:anti-anti-sigma factor [Alteribacter lacisalsi]|uniref:Anti-anti-sigma factor n=1 Tax=Alteribacter lacisalsi TaxID=2045244 RepID=A0A2W0H921_9BACI|nr:GAF domain-containing protein [Alteribacter lacisalsi]PYZ97431.1 anti-anti-sigma factor [Alteribacter lacisalsi]